MNKSVQAAVVVFHGPVIVEFKKKKKRFSGVSIPIAAIM
jgi:hypothetical protein